MKILIQNTQRLKIQNKLIVFLFSIAVVIIAFLIFFYQSFTVSLENERKTQVKHLTTSSMGIIHYFHDLTVSGELSTSDGKRYAMNALSNATYGDNGYFWINNGEGALLMHPHTPELINVNQIELTDVEGQYVFKTIIKKAKEGGGWVTYHWSKPESTGDYPKISYVSYFPPWDWIIGTGVYIDDMQKNINLVITKATGFLLVNFIIFVTFLIFIAHYLTSQLSELAVRDELTNLYTKRFLNEIIPSILERQKRLNNKTLAVTFIDIDFFKEINDNHGHDYGDTVLKKIANTILKNSRPDDYCIRYGGEEFVIIGVYEDKPSVIAAIERIRSEVSKLVFINNDVKFSVTISAGISIHKDTNKSFDKTIKQADKKLYQSKESGRNRVSI